MASRIGPDIRIAGALVASEDLSIAGIVEGTVTVLGSLTIERGAQISGEVTARDVVLLGELHVPIRATASVRLGPTAVLCADLSAARIIIEEGAVLEGHVRTTRNLDAAQLRPTIQAVAAAQPAVASPSPPQSLPATTTQTHQAPALPKQTPRETAPPRSAPVDSAARPRAASSPSSHAPSHAPTQSHQAHSPAAPRAAEPRRSERDREIPELPSIGRQKLVRR